MVKANDESYSEYKKRVLDPISPTICAAKWYNATIWLSAGKTSSCHLPIAHEINPDLLESNPSTIHNTDHKKNDRQLMLSGRKPPECEYCWKIEGLDSSAISDRVFKSIIYDDQDLMNLKGIDSKQNINLKTLELSFDRSCNLACCYCHPGFSTKWRHDILENGPYTNLDHDESVVFKNNGDHENIYENEETNPFEHAFWKWWPDLKNSLQELRVTGGEPLLSRGFWKLLRFIAHDPIRDTINFSVNTNLMVSSKKLEELFQISSQIHSFELYTSCEAYGAQAEFIRDGLNYKLFINNLELAIKMGNFKSVNIMLTINALSLFSLVDFLDNTLELKKKYGRFHPVWSFNILRFPSFFNISVLPDTLKKKLATDIEKWLLQNQANSLIHEIEIDSIQRLIKYLQQVKKSHHNAAPLEIMEHDFKSFLTQYMTRRNLSIRNVFPDEFCQWFRDIKL